MFVFGVQSAGPIYVAVADFHQQINSGLFVTGSQVLRFLTVLVSIMIPYTRGFRYRQVYGSEPGNFCCETVFDFEVFCSGIKLCCCLLLIFTISPINSDVCKQVQKFWSLLFQAELEFCRIPRGSGKRSMAVYLALIL